MKRTLRAASALAAVLLTAAIAAPGAAITDGALDGEGHPNVGMLLFLSDDGAGGTGLYRCTGTLISPTVILTAAHCTDGTIGKTIITFDTLIAEQPPSGIPIPDMTTGYTASPGLVNGETWYAGTAHTSPDYSNFTDMDTWNDYGVIVLDEPITHIEPAALAPLGYLDQFAQPALNKTLFTTVGYGTEVRKPVAGPQKPTPFSYPLVRRVATEQGQKLTTQILQVNGNGNNQHGTGGTCFGDSGGPSFLNGYLVTVTSYGYTSNCRYIDGLQRVDIADALDWLATFGVTPAA